MSEDRKRITVDQAVEDLMARDTQYREELKKQVDQKLNKKYSDGAIGGKFQ
jgi:hypothetical protein